ncbi:GNAT family N-acetyltransferase [Brevibacillus choshinensis]|uniref:GNAT family N-acetyltransferase n=1 Tax=Brevibacillus choshinensis TaxID=54911 RepID=UPI002E23F01C|nr:GNAT family N-acetyltransferase [Brevibacillus choshinensis]MED4754102.1 GNAT family N-acetyltransferase [Brevibacillus choshinensis]
MITFRPIFVHELHAFAAVSTPTHRQQSIIDYVQEMFTKGAMRPEWCFILEREGEGIGRVAFWTLPGKDSPSDIVLLDLPWEDENGSELAELLWQHLLVTCRQMGVKQLGYVLDSPAMAPQWQDHEEQRQKILGNLGFHKQRETSRFEWKNNPGITSAPNVLPHMDERVIYRSLSEVGEIAFIDAIMRGSASTLDRQIAQERSEYGPLSQAQEIYQDLQGMSYEPDWWELAYTPDDQLIGFIIPTKSPTFATIGYIGVLPEFRGRGYVDLLLNRGLFSLVQAGESFIRTDTDLQNQPMANAFLRAGFHLFAQRSEYRFRSFG